jgi:hypothetical protein
MAITDIFKGIDKVGEAVDDNVYSEQERNEMFTRRLEIDANSDNQLAKMIRPIITLLAGLVWLVMHIAAIFREIDAEALYSADAVFMTCIGFYFDSRRREKIAKRKALAAVKIEKEKVQQQKIQSRREARLERIKARRANK